jgi:WD40 repeat protein/uncharacterized protein YegL
MRRHQPWTAHAMARISSSSHGLMLVVFFLSLIRLLQLQTSEVGIRAAIGNANDPRDVFFVTDDDARPGDGCDAIAVKDSATGQLIASGKTIQNPGRLAATSDGAFAASPSNYGGPFLYLVAKTQVQPAIWKTYQLSYGVVEGGPIAVTPDDRYLLVAVSGSAVDVHSLADLKTTASKGLKPSLGAPFAVLRGRGAVTAIVISPDSQTAYVICADGQIYLWHLVDPISPGSVLSYVPIAGGIDMRVRNTNAAISPDGRWLVVNGAAGHVNIIDTQTGQSTFVKTPGLAEAWGLGFNYAAQNRAVLAVNGRSAVAVYELMAGPTLRMLALATLPPQTDEVWAQFGQQGMARLAALAWTGRGDGLIVATGLDREFRILNFYDEATPRLDKRFDVDSCINSPSWHIPLDVLSLNDRIRIPSPTPTTRPTETLTPTIVPASETPTATAWSSSTPESTVTASPHPTLPPTSTPTRVPSPLFLPLLLHERCTPGIQRTDIVLVIDASSSMTELTHAGRSKLAAAVEAAGTFLDQMHFDAGDQAAVVTFNSDATLLAPLTTARALLNAALGAITTAQFTRIDRGIAVAREELASTRHRPGNTPVMIVLTDGRANPVPVSVAESEARQAKDAGIVIFTVGLGNDLDTEGLRSIASRPGWFYSAPSAEELAGIYRGIAVAIPCPASVFWGKR